MPLGIIVKYMFPNVSWPNFLYYLLLLTFAPFFLSCSINNMFSYDFSFRSRFLIYGFLPTQTITASDEFIPTQAGVTGKGHIIWPDSGKLNVTRAIAYGV